MPTIHLLRRVMRKFDAAYTSEVAARCGHDLALTLPQYLVLSAIAGSAEPPSQTELVRVTGSDRSTLAQIVENLARKRLLRRARSKEDRRANELRLTQDGSEVLARVRPIVALVEESLLATLTDRQRATFRSALAGLAFLDAAEPRGRKAA